MALALNFATRPGALVGVISTPPAEKQQRVWVAVSLDTDLYRQQGTDRRAQNYAAWTIAESEYMKLPALEFPREPLELVLARSAHPLEAVLMASVVEAQFEATVEAYLDWQDALANVASRGDEQTVLRRYRKRLT